MAAVVDRLAERIGRLKHQAAAVQALATDLGEELTLLRRLLRDDASGRLAAAITCAVNKAEEDRRKAARRAAASGARSLEWRPVRGGAQLVRIDGSAWIRLARKDAALLRVLARTSHAGPDGFPGWLTYDELSAWLGQKTGLPPTRRALVESVHRIRKALRRADTNEYLLEVDRVGGRLRFLLRGAR